MSKFHDTFAVSSLFTFTVGTHVLGSFTSCEGLGCYTEMVERREGGQNDHVRRFPTRLVYTNLTLARPLTQQTVAVWAWMEQASNPYLPPLPLPATLVALGPDRRPLIRWAMLNVVPVRWSGPSFSAEQNQAATETLEVAHRGFVVLPGV